MIPYCILIMTDEDDREFMASLFEKYNRLMYREIYQIVHDPWIAEDLMQSTIEKLIDKVSELRQKERDNLVNYIITAAKNRAKNYLRDNAKHELLSFDEQIDFPDPDNSGSEMELHLVKQSDLEKFAQVWPQLDERSRYLLESRYFLEKTPKELAQELGIKPDSVRMALTRARKCAYQLLKKELAFLD